MNFETRRLLLFFQTVISFVLCRKIIIIITSIFSQFTTIYGPKNLENAPAQDLSQLCHWYTTGLLHKIKFCCLCKNFFLIESFLSNRRLRVVPKHKSSSLVCHWLWNTSEFYLDHFLFSYISCLPDDVLCKIASWSDDI